jgi:sporulation protein YlmC with PRC-barrel domain
MSARELFIGAHLLDRQILDRHGVRCGKVDDLELTVDEDGPPRVTAVIVGPGALLTRTHHTRLGHWLRRLIPVLSDGHDGGRIPIRHVAALDDHVTVSLEAEQLASHHVETWVQDHVIAHLPGSGIRARQ